MPYSHSPKRRSSHKRTTHPRTHHRRRHHHRRVGAVSKDAMTEGLTLFAGAVAGSVAVRFLNAAVAKQTAITISPKLINAIEIIGGGALAVLSENPLFKGLGIGIGGEAAVSEFQALGVLTGLGALPPMVPFQPKPNTTLHNRPQTVGEISPQGNYRPPVVGMTHRRRAMASM